MGKRKKKPPYDRFIEMVAKSSNGCWSWTGCVNNKGYAQFWDGTGQCLAHRWSYEYFSQSEIPNGLVIDHLCRNPGCVNPDHLEAVTMAENTARGNLPAILTRKYARQTHCKRGHPLFGSNLVQTVRGRSCKKCQRMNADRWRKNNRDRVNRLQQKRRAAAASHIAAGEATANA